MSNSRSRKHQLSPAALFDKGDLPDSFFRAVAETAPDLISVIGPDAKFTYSNPTASRLFGIKPGGLEGFSKELFHPDDFSTVMREFTELLADGGSRQLTDHRLHFGDSGWVWIQTHAINMIDDPRVNGVVMVSRDISAQKRREEELARAEIAVKFGHWRWDKGNVGPAWSEGIYAILGLDPAKQPSDMSWSVNLLEPADKEKIINDVVKALTAGDPLNRIVSMLHADGDYRRVLMMGSVERDGSGEATSIVGICQDVTALQKATDAIQKSEQEFRLLAEHSTDVIIRYDIKGQVAYISPSLERMLGYAPDTFIGRHTVDFIHADDRERIRNRILEMYEDRQTKRLLFRMIHKNGSDVWVESMVSPLLEDANKVVGFVSSSRDVTTQQVHEQELNAARQRAEEANLTKSRFLANMSHELRTPLNAILGFSEMMTRHVFGPIGVPQYEDYANMIHESGAHLLALIGDILDMSKIEAGKYDLKLAAVDLVGVVRKATRMVQSRAREGGLDLVVALDGLDGVRLLADERALTQIMLNLLSNAVKFTPAGGCVTVSAASLGEQHIVISIADTGVGIEPDNIQRVLRPFEQVVQHPELASQGTGLGLPLVQALVEMQNGSFSIRSTPGVGTTVDVELPRVSVYALAGANVRHADPAE